MGLLDDAIREHLDLKRARGADPAEIERLEREALGPVRRDPATASMAADPKFPSPGHYADEDHADDFPDNGHEQPVEEIEPSQPKRRFLRRNRGAARAVDDRRAQTSAHDLEDGEFAEYDRPHEHDEHDADDGDEPATELHQTGEPPQLTFNRPPSQPRFPVEPPSGEPSDDDEAGDPATPGDAPEAADDAEPEPHPHGRHPDLQPTHEFDVEDAFDDDAALERAQDRGRSDEGPEKSAEGSDPDVLEGSDPDVLEEPDADVLEEPDEDVLEETPEFLHDTPEHDRLWFEQRPPKDFDFDG
jgi:hypothetical protein